MIKKIRVELCNNIGKKVTIIYNGSRNKVDKYKGYIYECYDSIFLVKLNNGLTKSFSYVDVLIGTIFINY